MKKEKEIGIEKLIELLNEYVKQLGIGDYVGWHNEETVRNSDYFLTKKFGFIKRLVENDKIDREKVIDTAKSSVIDTYYYEEGIDDIYIPLLMVLAVEDNPIEFLISILK